MFRARRISGFRAMRARVPGMAAAYNLCVRPMIIAIKRISASDGYPIMEAFHVIFNPFIVELTRKQSVVASLSYPCPILRIEACRVRVCIDTCTLV